MSYSNGHPHWHLQQAMGDEAGAGAPVRPHTQLATSARSDANNNTSQDIAHLSNIEGRKTHSNTEHFAGARAYPPCPSLRHSQVQQIDSEDYNSPYPDQQQLVASEVDVTGLPSNFYDFLPHTRAYLASAPSFTRSTNQTISNTDGADGGHDDWSLHYQPLPSYDTAYTVDNRPPDPNQSQVLNYNPYYSPQTSPTAYDALHAHLPQPRRAYSVVSAPRSLQQYGQSAQLPAIQEWRTDNLPTSRNKSQKQTDDAVKRKQEIYRRKGEARRRTIADGMAASQTLADNFLSLAPSCGVIKPAHPSKKRRKVAPKTPRELNDDTPGTFEVLFDPLSAVPVNNQNQHDVTRIDLTATEPPLPTTDELPQPIVSKYEDYKWSVFRFEVLLSAGYDHAERWIQALFESTLQSAYQERHFSHISQGFIQDGTRLSIIALHNAANPFEYEPTPTSTVTIGVYGYHWYQHSAIHWTTLASDQRALFSECVDRGLLAQTHKWTFDAPKASERRFHRAYWLAANRLDLKGMLNRGPSKDTPHDFIGDKSPEDPDKEFGIREADLMNEWDVTGAEAAVAWQKVLDELVELGDGADVGDAGWQHLVISNSEC